MKPSTKFIAFLTASLFLCAQAMGKESPVSPVTNPDNIIVADAAPLSSDEMSELRGGFIDPSGLIFNFAVNVRTDLNGALVFTRSLTVTPSGISGQLQATASNNVLPQNLPGNVSIGVIGNGNGITVTNASGQTTTILNQTAGGAPASIIVNNASNANVTQAVNVALTLKNVAAMTGFLHMTTQSALAQNNVLHSLGLR